MASIEYITTEVDLDFFDIDPEKNLNDDNSKNDNSVQTRIIPIRGQKKPNPCTFCEASFSEKDSLNIHIAVTHNGKKPFECSKCQESFFHKNQLYRHKKLVHEGKKIIKCPMCDRDFLCQKYLQKHLQNVHGDNKYHLKVLYTLSWL